MQVTKQEILNRAYRTMNLDPDDVNSNITDEIELMIREVQDIILFHAPWDWRQREYYFTTRAPYETGTISVTKNNAAITGSSTVWTDSMKTGHLLVNGNLYKVDSVASNTSLKLKAPYPDDTTSGLSYKIVFPDYVINPYVASLINIMWEGREIESKDSERMVIEPAETGEVMEAAITGTTDVDFYNTGTVTMTQASTTVTGVGTTFTSDMEGMTFRVNEFAEPYVIRAFVSTTSLTLDREYQGSTGSGKGYKINPAGSLILSFRAIPDDNYFIKVSYLSTGHQLILSNDLSIIPNHQALLQGILWKVAEAEDKNPVRIQQARADFERSLKQLSESYKVVTNQKWRSELEGRARRIGGVGRYNPLQR